MPNILIHDPSMSISLTFEHGMAHVEIHAADSDELVAELHSPSELTVMPGPVPLRNIDGDPYASGVRFSPVADAGRIVVVTPDGRIAEV